MRVLLATGPDERLDAFHLRVCWLLNAIDGRGQTMRYACMAEDLDRAIEAARLADVTLQEIVVTGSVNPRTHELGGGASVTVRDGIETYPVLHAGTHGMKWQTPAAGGGR